MILSIYNLQINITSIVFYETSIIEKENSISLYRFYISTLKKKNSAPAWLQGHHCVVRNNDDFWLLRNDQAQRAPQLKFFLEEPIPFRTP